MPGPVSGGWRHDRVLERVWNAAESGGSGWAQLLGGAQDKAGQTHWYRLCTTLCLQQKCTALHFFSTEFVGPFAPQANFKELAPCYADNYYLSNMLVDNSRETYANQGIASYWLAKDGFTGPAFIYELLSISCITGFSLRNTVNGVGNNFGTNGYRLLTSVDGQDFREVHNGNLPDARNKFQSTPCIKVELVEPVLAKQVRFDVISFYGRGPGLHYFKAHCDLSR